MALCASCTRRPDITPTQEGAGGEEPKQKVTYHICILEKTPGGQGGRRAQSRSRGRRRVGLSWPGRMQKMGWIPPDEVTCSGWGAKTQAKNREFWPRGGVLVGQRKCSILKCLL